MLKEELVLRMVDALDVIEDTGGDRKIFDDAEIEDILVEAGIPIQRGEKY